MTFKTASYINRIYFSYNAYANNMIDLHKKSNEQLAKIYPDYDDYHLSIYSSKQGKYFLINGFTQ